MDFDDIDDPELPVWRAVQRALAATGTVEQVGRAVLEAVGDSLGWRLGLIWRLAEDGHELVPVVCWRARIHAAVEFEAISLGTRVRIGEGLPGQVWERETILWEPDVLRMAYFRRTDVARREDLRGALALPLRAGGQVAGVMEFFTDRLQAPIGALESTFLAIGRAVGARLAQVAQPLT